MSASGQGRQQRAADGGHAGVERNGGLGPLQVGELGFQAAHSRVGSGRVGEVRPFAAAHGLDLAVRFEREGDVLVERHAVRAGGGIRRLTGMDAARTQSPDFVHGFRPVLAAVKRLSRQRLPHGTWTRPRIRPKAVHMRRIPEWPKPLYNRCSKIANRYRHEEG